MTCNRRPRAAIPRELEANPRDLDPDDAHAGEPVRLVVTGAGGALGQAFLAQLPSHHKVHALTRADLDISDHHAVMQAIAPLAPDAVVNLAAMTAVDRCQADPRAAYRANALGPQSLAIATRSCGAWLLHVSTDYVFDGEKGESYDEVDLPNPLNIYGRSKLAGERFVRHLQPEHMIVRTAWVIGGRSDVVSRSLPHLAAGEKVDAVVDRMGSPTPVRHLAARLLPLLLTGRFGTYHLAGPDGMSWHDVLTRCVILGGLPGAVRPVRAAELRLPAPRPRRSDLTSVLFPDSGVDPMPPLDVGLKELIEEVAR
jgi:dTDP-4-dehydrorhamnose reductase